MVTLGKRPNAPASLAVEKQKGLNGSYSCDDVLEALEEDFLGKCYICGSKHPTSLNVEHSDEHRKNVDKMFDWNNLFYACCHCNGTKNDMYRTVPSNLLNCTDPSQMVDLWIEYRVVTDQNLKSKASITENISANFGEYQQQTANTIRLLDAVYNGTGSPLRSKEADNLMKHVIKEINSFNELLLKYISEQQSSNKEEIKASLEDGINDTAPYAAFKRWILRDLNIEL